MSDYLGNLAARSLGLVPVARPRVASRFEPASGPPRPGVPLASTYVVVESADRPSAVVPPHTTRTFEQDTIALAQPRTLPIVQQEAIEVRANHTGWTRPRRTTRSDGEAPDPLVGSATDRLSSATEPPASPTVFAPHPIASLEPHLLPIEPPQPVTARTVAAPVTTDASRPESEGRPVLSADPEYVRRQRLEDRLSVLERSLRRPASPGEPGSRVVPPAPTVPVIQPPEPAPPVIRTASALIVAPESTRTVHVTIGRVDVRAVVPTPAAPRTRTRAAAPAASLSLEEYLKQRSGP